MNKAGRNIALMGLAFMFAASRAPSGEAAAVPNGKGRAKQETSSFFRADSAFTADTAYNSQKGGSGGKAPDLFSKDWVKQALMSSASHKVPPKFYDQLASALMGLGTHEREAAVAEIAATHALDAIIDASGPEFGNALWALGQKNACRLFAGHVGDFVAIAEYAGPGTGAAFNSLNDRCVAGEFGKYSSTFVEISKCAQGSTGVAFSAVGRQTDRFEAHRAEFVRMAQVALGGTGSLYCSLVGNPALEAEFDRWVAGEIPLPRFIVPALASGEAAFWLGQPLDGLAGKPERREAFLRSLSGVQAAALLASMPDYLFMTTDELLLGRLSGICNERKISATAFLASNGISLDSESGRNLIFRAAGAGRLAGERGIFSAGEIRLAASAIAKPLGEIGFDQRYYCMLANFVQDAKEAGMGTLLALLDRELAAALPQDNGLNWGNDKRRAITYIRNSIAQPKWAGLPLFDREKCLGSDGKLAIIQVYSKKDAGADWLPAQQWASKYGAQKQGALGELVYENGSTRVLLYMGKDAAENDKFVEKAMAQNPGAMLVLHGMDYVLAYSPRGAAPDTGMAANKNIPVPGSCHQNADVWAYAAAHPGASELFFMSCPGMAGQAANAALDALANSAAPAPCYGILKGARKEIEAHGASIKLTLTSGKSGEMLLNYVYKAGEDSY